MRIKLSLLLHFGSVFALFCFLLPHIGMVTVQDLQISPSHLSNIIASLSLTLTSATSPPTTTDRQHTLKVLLHHLYRLLLNEPINMEIIIPFYVIRYGERSVISLSLSLCPDFFTLAPSLSASYRPTLPSCLLLSFFGNVCNCEEDDSFRRVDD